MKNIAIVGVGGMGAGHAVAIASGTGNPTMIIPGIYEKEAAKYHDYDTDLNGILNLIGVCDIRPERQEWAKKQGYRLYDTFDDVIADPEVDIVLIAVPNDQHHDLSVRAMRAGKHVLCEKPVMMSSAELEDVIQVSRETGKVFYPRQNRRWDEDYLIVKKIFDEKLLGEVYNIECRIQGSRGIPGDWRSKKAHGGGEMLDWGVHIIDRISVMIPEKIKYIYAHMTHITNDEVDDGFKMQMIFESGRTVVLEVATVDFIKLPMWYVAGTDGTAVIEDWGLDGKMIRLKSWEDKDAAPILAGSGLTKTMAPRLRGSTEELPLPEVRFDANELYVNLVDVIEGRAEQIVKPEEALRVLRIMEAAFKSDETHTVVEFE